MKTRLLILIPLFAGLILSSGCNKEDEIVTAMLHAHSKMGSQDFAYDTEVTNSEGLKLKFTKVQAYLSGFMFHGDDGMQMIDDSYVLVKPGTMMYELGGLPSGSYKEFGFSVGVDSTANRLTNPADWPTDHALSSNNPDHAFWSWNTGFIFIVLEGEVDVSSAMDGSDYVPFVYHIGLDKMKREVLFSKNQDVKDDFTVGIEIDYLKLLNGIDMRARQMTHSMGDGAPLAESIANNVQSAFTLE